MKPICFVFAFLGTTALADVASTLPTANAVFPDLEAANVQLGQFLFYDPILSGNKNIACATCHHPSLGTADGVSLGIGEGGIGLGMKRIHDPKNPPEARIPRNAPALWNLGATEFTVMFHDGRIEASPDKPSAMRTPLGVEMVTGFKSPLAAQAMFPVLSADEMAGHYSENDVSKAVRMGQSSQEGGAWDIIAARVENIPEYRAMFDAQIGSETPITFQHIANVIADFIAFEWRADDSLFDRHLRGEGALEGAALLGMELFYGEAQCGTCHSGQFQTDHAFHAIAMPQLGPGKAAPFENHVRDTGRMGVTGKSQDAYAFRTPSLRNLSVTGPYGHAGAYSDLRDVVEHHLSPVASLENYDPALARLPAFSEVEDWRIQADEKEVSDIAAVSELAPNHGLTDSDVDALMAFLATLDDTKMGQGRLGIPQRVPSGLPLD
ncbi:cytochrome-c peroxidase [Falsihalocynthiibacter sp. S25ZX9]|uniref:cytochrome-c peroxidase n=1 Tax=Falsihalocynthiibacter sp. S25ZX9 TaxID=3240870 RepID=UPI00351061F8